MPANLSPVFYTGFMIKRAFNTPAYGLPVCFLRLLIRVIKYNAMSRKIPATNNKIGMIAITIVLKEQYAIFSYRPAPAFFSFFLLLLYLLSYCSLPPALYS